MSKERKDPAPFKLTAEDFKLLNQVWKFPAAEIQTLQAKSPAKMERIFWALKAATTWGLDDSTTSQINLEMMVEILDESPEKFALFFEGYNSVISSLKEYKINLHEVENYYNQNPQKCKELLNDWSWHDAARAGLPFSKILEYHKVSKHKLECMLGACRYQGIELAAAEELYDNFRGKIDPYLFPKVVLAVSNGVPLSDLIRIYRSSPEKLERTVRAFAELSKAQVPFGEIENCYDESPENLDIILRNRNIINNGKISFKDCVRILKESPVNTKETKGEEKSTGRELPDKFELITRYLGRYRSMMDFQTLERYYNQDAVKLEKILKSDAYEKYHMYCDEEVSKRLFSGIRNISGMEAVTDFFGNNAASRGIIDVIGIDKISALANTSPSKLLATLKPYARSFCYGTGVESALSFEEICTEYDRNPAGVKQIGDFLDNNYNIERFVKCLNAGIKFTTIFNIYEQSSEKLENLLNSRWDNIKDAVSDYSKAVLAPVLYRAIIADPSIPDVAKNKFELKFCLPALNKMAVHHLFGELSSNPRMLVQMKLFSGHWHAPLQQTKINKERDYGGDSWLPLFGWAEKKIPEGPSNPFHIPEGWKLVARTTPAALKKEGEDLKHCVGGYTAACLTGNSHIISIVNQKGEPVSTIEYQIIAGKLQRTQHYGERNRVPCPESLAIENWLDKQIADKSPGFVIDFDGLEKARLQRVNEVGTLKLKAKQELGFDPFDEAKLNHVHQTYKDILANLGEAPREQKGEEKGETKEPAKKEGLSRADIKQIQDGYIKLRDLRTIELEGTQILGKSSFSLPQVKKKEKPVMSDADILVKLNEQFTSLPGNQGAVTAVAVEKPKGEVKDKSKSAHGEVVLETIGKQVALLLEKDLKEKFGKKADIKIVDESKIRIGKASPKLVMEIMGKDASEDKDKARPNGRGGR